ncbi:MAG: CAP domain-containing protein [Candidatus Thiodiazotropha sp.]
MSLQAAVWSAEELVVVDLVNQQRSYFGLDPVYMNDDLHTSAQRQSQSMADYNYFDHVTLAGPYTGEKPGERIRDSGYDVNSWGENIAAGQGANSGIQAGYLDAAHEVMYGTDNFAEINSYFTSNFNVSATDWGDLGEGITTENWNDWYGVVGSGWMGSEGHRNNILNGGFTHLGVGYVWDESDANISAENFIMTNPDIWPDGEFPYPLYSYWTQHFASGELVAEPAPVPLPAVVWLMGSGLIGMMWVGRKPLKEA